MLSVYTVGVAKHMFISFPRNHQNRLQKSLFCCMSMNNQREVQSETESHVHYNHTDPSKYARWTARESFQFMYARPWQRVNDFYLDIVRANLSLSLLFGPQTILDHNDTGIAALSDQSELESVASEDRSGRWARTTFKIILSYHGGSFDGWQKQPGLNTVQSIVEVSLGKFVDEKKTQLLKDKGLPIEGCAVVAGRTDKGVTGLQQVCSFYTWKKDVKPRDIEDAINQAALGKLRVVSVSEVSRVFHPNFSAKWRRYLYIFPLTDGYRDQGNDNVESRDISRYNEIHDSSSKDEIENQEKSYVFSVSKVNRLLRKLEGKLLSYKMFARDTKASRNDGPPTECFVYHARAMEVKLPTADCGEETKAMCVELVANRFLRKMVRVLVATSIREAAAGAEDDALIKLMDATCRRATAPPAPPDGLCLVDVGYTEFDPQKCFILIE
ncbi:hypothetical protein VIGAN_01039000 [Vigna angularis var. angularis]|uniref:tRNA pseudouridine synthase n=1 Tax=Vigna angularis var. angularis TaxID=157739 RepID=A0A0S3QX72_PHAAN|nr:uncharacterized protein LOC108322883 [Vigna angularis]BAT72942.1 hypothetical protein VIGAN_01039000 [Vigna angularis var. angularis]